MKLKGRSTEALWLMMGIGGLLLVVVLLAGREMSPGWKMSASALGGVMVLSGLLGVLNVGGVTLEGDRSVRLRRGEEGPWELCLRRTRFLGGIFLFGQTPKEKTLRQLTPDQWETFALSFDHRGRYVSAGLRLYAPFPFGPFDAGLVQVPADIRVLPRQVPANLLRLPLLTSEFDRAPQLRGSRDGVFKGIAGYSKEHSLRDINWKASARSGTLMVNEFEGILPSRKVLVAPDPMGSREAFEWVLDFAYSILEIMHQDWKVYLWCYDGTIYHLPANSLHAVEDYFLDLYPMGLRPAPDQEFPGLKILVTSQTTGLGPYKKKHWRICHAWNIAVGDTFPTMETLHA